MIHRKGVQNQRKKVEKETTKQRAYDRYTKHVHNEARCWFVEKKYECYWCKKKFGAQNMHQFPKCGDLVCHKCLKKLKCSECQACLKCCWCGYQ